jgi:hypothetical protein
MKKIFGLIALIIIGANTAHAQFSARTNLFYWAGGLINAGVEYNPTPKIGLLINAGYGPLTSKSWEHNWGGWFAEPEVRYYLDEQGHWFTGVAAIAGHYDLKITDTGRTGSVYAGGVTGGYRAKLTDKLGVDFSLGLGYGQLKYDTYTFSNDTRTHTRSRCHQDRPNAYPS